jgi:hypothetical protein
MQWSVMLVLLSLCLIPGVLVGQEAERNPAGTPASPAPFVLTIQERVLSLGAQDASLQAIIEEIGRQMHIDVAVHPPVEEPLTLAFERLSLAEAIEQFRRYANIVYRTTPAQGQPWQEPKLAFVEPKLTKHGKLEKVTGFLGSFNA